jgi:hypothetical protein
MLNDRNARTHARTHAHTETRIYTHTHVLARYPILAPPTVPHQYPASKVPREYPAHTPRVILRVAAEYLLSASQDR